MKNHGMRSVFSLLSLLPVGAMIPSSGYGELVVHPKVIGTSVDVGQVFKDETEQPITRTGVYLTVSGTYHKKLEVRAALGGLFWYGFPELTTPSRLLRFGPGVGQARFIYSFGDDTKSPFARLHFGLFPVKYNSDARNLGEYLHRSGTYPAYVWTGGWSYLNAASYLGQGFLLNLPTFGGKVVHDFTFFMQRDPILPLHDFSPGYVLAIKPVSSLELGGGMVWANAISFNSKNLAPEETDNAYHLVTKLPLKAMAVQDWGDSTQWGYYSFRGVKIMGRVAIDFGMMLGGNLFAPGDFKLYSEIALLGVANQPFYYDNRWERMPMMAGINIPTFGLLTKLTVETEYYKSRYPNTIYYPFDSQQGLPIPLGAGGDEANPLFFSDSAVSLDPGRYTKDDWKWSVYANRKITDGIIIHAQAASDHLRHANPEAKPSNEPYTQTPSDWYYVLRLEFGIF